VEGDNKTRAAPDAMVVFGRPPGYRGSCIQHREDGVVPQVYRPDGRRFETFVEMVQRAETERQRAERLAERLRALGLDPDME